jgi:hypothetical protein
MSYSFKSATVNRGGATARYWTHETEKVTLHIRKGISLEFCIASKGGGTTQIALSFKEDDFEAIVNAMMEVNRHVAMQLISQALANELAAQKGHEEKIRQDIYRKLKSKTRQWWSESSGHEEHIAAITLDGLEKILSTLA